MTEGAEESREVDEGVEVPSADAAPEAIGLSPDPEMVERIFKGSQEPGESTTFAIEHKDSDLGAARADDE